MAESEKITIPVKVFNYDLKIITDEQPEYVKQVAQYVDSKIFEVTGGASTSSLIRAILLAALNITDELFKERKRIDQFSERIINQTKILNKKLSELQPEIED